MHFTDCFESRAYRGGPVKQISLIKLKSPEDCQEQCQKTEKCAYWTLDKSKKCWLNDKTATEHKSSNGEIGGPRDCSKSGGMVLLTHTLNVESGFIIN